MNKSKRQSGNKLNLLFIFLFICYFFFFQQVKVLISPVSDRFFAMANFKNFYISNLASNLKNYFIDKDLLLTQNEGLRRELEDKKLEIVNLTQNLNASSSNLLPENFINTKILNKGYFSLYDEVLLDKGFINGVNKGDGVYAYPNFYLGEIGRIEKDTSILSLASRSGNKIEGLIKVASSTNGLAVDLLGVGGGDYTFEIPESIDISIGSVIYLSLDETKEFGVVAQIEKINSSLYKKVLVRGRYNRSESEMYFIKIKN